MDHVLDHFFYYFFGPFFWDHFIGGKRPINTQGGVGCSLLILWGGRQCVITKGGVRDGLLLGREGWEVDVIENTTF